MALGGVRLVLTLAVLIVALHLADDLVGHLVERRHLVRRDAHLDVVELPDDGLELAVVNAVERLDHLQVVSLALVLLDGRLDRRKVLLVTNVDVVQEGALSGEERTRNLEGLRVPVLRLLLLHWGVEGGVFFHLDDEADLGAVAKIAHR